MKNSHIPVLLDAVIDHIPQIEPGQWGLDLTFGRGGHSQAILESRDKAKIIGWDRDPQAIQFGMENFSALRHSHRLELEQQNFHFLDQALEDRNATGAVAEFRFILVDLGVSSPQLDEPERGFSFYHEGPLDMRMNPEDDGTAADIVNNWSESELVELFQQLGEVRSPQRVVRAIVEDRKTRPFSTTQQLSQMIERIVGWRKKGHHPATQYFLALRMEVNSELSALEKSIESMIKALSPGGRLLVITFHSLEDRIVKWTLKNSLEGFLVNKKVIQATWDEKKTNPRARSAKLRVFEKNAKDAETNGSQTLS